MQQVSIITTILVPEEMEAEAELVRSEYVNYFRK